jgi:hypothetical protein
MLPEIFPDPSFNVISLYCVTYFSADGNPDSAYWPEVGQDRYSEVPCLESSSFLVDSYEFRSLSDFLVFWQRAICHTHPKLQTGYALRDFRPFLRLRLITF